MDISSTLFYERGNPGFIFYDEDLHVLAMSLR